MAAQNTDRLRQFQGLVISLVMIFFLCRGLGKWIQYQIFLLFYKKHNLCKFLLAFLHIELNQTNGQLQTGKFHIQGAYGFL